MTRLVLVSWRVNGRLVREKRATDKNLVPVIQSFDCRGHRVSDIQVELL